MIFGAFQAIFQVGINIRPAKHGVDGMGGGDIHGAMAAVSSHGSPNGVLQRRHL